MSAQPFTPGGPGIRKHQFGDMLLFSSIRQRGKSAPTVLRPFQLVAVRAPDGTPRVRVVISSIAGLIPPGFNAPDDPPYLIAPAAGANYVWVRANTHEQEVTSVAIGTGANPPEPTAGSHYAPIGIYTYVAAVGNTPAKLDTVNYGYGPADVNICQTHFSNPVEYGVSITLKAGI